MANNPAKEERMAMLQAFSWLIRFTVGDRPLRLSNFSTSFVTSKTTPPSPNVPMLPDVSMFPSPFFNIPILLIILAAAGLVGFTTGSGELRAIGVSLHDGIEAVDTTDEKVGREEGGV